MEKSELLGQLRIDRQEPARSSRGRWVGIGVIAALLIAGVGAWIAFGRAGAVIVKTATAQAMTGGNGAASASVLDATGYVTARRQATVSSKVTGRVAELLIEEGQQVKAGDVLARLDPIDAQAQLDLSQAQLDAARSLLTDLNVQLAQAERDWQRMQDMVARKLVSEQAREQARESVDSLKAKINSQSEQIKVAQRGLGLARVGIENTVVTAPFDGVIIDKAAQQGEIVSPISAGGGFTRTGIGTIVDMDSLEVDVDVNESYIGRVQAGQPTEATLNAYPDWKIPGRVIAIIPTADKSKATVKVRISIDVKDARIVPDMGARVAFLEERKPAQTGAPPPQGVLVPARAVIGDGDASSVFVVKDNKVEKRKVRLGQTYADSRQVLGGVARGERVVVGPPEGLADGMRVDLEDKP